MTIAMFEIDDLELVLLQSSMQKLKSLNLRPKILHLDIFGREFENNIVIFEIRTLEVI